jgi:hypothetical protein
MPSELGQETLEELTTLYLASLNDRELQAYHIAVNHLGMSFTMERSNGFRQWKKERDERIRLCLQNSVRVYSDNSPFTTLVPLSVNVAKLLEQESASSH